MQKHTLAEAFIPDVMHQLQQNSRILQQLSGQTGMPVPAPSSSGQTQPQPVSTFASLVNFPLNFDAFVESLISGNVQGITPQLFRKEVALAAGSIASPSTATLTVPVPSDSAAMLIQSRTLYSDYYTSDVTVTVRVDTNPPILEDAPMPASLQLSGAFTGIVSTQTTYELKNVGSTAVTFYEDTVAALLTPETLSKIVQPVLQLNSQMVQRIATYAVTQGL